MFPVPLAGTCGQGGPGTSGRDSGLDLFKQFGVPEVEEKLPLGLRVVIERSVYVAGCVVSVLVEFAT